LVSTEPFQVWTLAVNQYQEATLNCTDGNKTLLTFQKIERTDFPLSKITLYAAPDECLGGLVVTSSPCGMLTSEY
jgi:hypothetical protein